jgi:anti-sigma factor RsiW
VSHLGERLTALVDGELNHDERDRALAHLACCEQCRAEADAQRRLKRRLRSLTDVTPSADLLGRLQAMSEPGGPLPPPPRPLPGAARPPVMPRPGAQRLNGERPAGRGRGGRAGEEIQSRRRPRRRYLALGVATFAVVGVGVVSFVAGAEPGQLPRVAPALEQFAVEHALTSGDIPVTDKHPAEGSTPRP